VTAFCRTKNLGGQTEPQAEPQIYAPSLDELANDLQTQLTAAGFSSQDIADILQILLQPPGAQ
jgi:hypothetical protein